MRRVVILAGLMFAMLGGSAYSQERGQAGIVMGYPASVGMLWRVSDRVAIRPEATFTRSSGETKSGGGVAVASNTSWTAGVSVSGLFYLGAVDGGLRTYVSPRFTYSRLSSGNETRSTTTTTGESTGNAYGIAGSFGAEYMLGRRFAVFGEVGLGYSHTSQVGNQTLTVPTAYDARSETTSSGVAVRSAVGVVVFF